VREVAVVHVRRHDGPDSRDLLEIFQQVRPADPHADESETDIVVRARGLHLKAPVDDLIYDRAGAAVA
jgi:hypothetical protein